MATTAVEMENTRALSDPTLRARFSLSFSAQMMLSQDSVKESSAAAANALLSFSGVRYRTAWTGILREQLDCRTRPCNFVPHLKRLPEQATALCGSRA